MSHIVQKCPELAIPKDVSGCKHYVGVYKSGAFNAGITHTWRRPASGGRRHFLVVNQGVYFTMHSNAESQTHSILPGLRYRLRKFSGLRYIKAMNGS